MAQPIQCPACTSTQIIRKGTTAAGIEKYQCHNPTCQRYFQASYHTSPFATHAAYMRAWRENKHRDHAGSRTPAARVQRATRSLQELAPLEALQGLPYPSRLIGS